MKRLILAFLLILGAAAPASAQNRAEIERTMKRATSNPNRGDGLAEPAPGDFRTTHVGDATDTSPYTTDNPVTGISLSAYIANMARLIEALPVGTGAAR